MPHRILENQNDPELIRLLQASAVAYKNAKSQEFIFTYVLIFLAIAYPISYVFIKNDNVKQSLFGVAFLVTVLTWFLTDTFKGNTSKGALLKEQFDVTLFNLPWKFLLPKTDMVEVIKLSKQYKGNPIQDWYSPNISENIPDNTVIAICQRVNSGWDIELRSKYKTSLIVMLIIYTIAVFILWAVKSVDGRTIFLLYFSLLSFYTHILTLIRGNTGAIRKRKSIVTKLDEYINNKKEFQIGNLRDVQDEIYNIRQEPAKVPDFFFRLYNKKLQEEFEDYIQEVNKRYAVPGATV